MGASARGPASSWVQYSRRLRRLYTCVAPHILISTAFHCAGAPRCDLLNQPSGQPDRQTATDTNYHQPLFQNPAKSWELLVHVHICQLSLMESTLLIRDRDAKTRRPTGVKSRYLTFLPTYLHGVIDLQESLADSRVTRDSSACMKDPSEEIYAQLVTPPLEPNIMSLCCIQPELW